MGKNVQKVTVPVNVDWALLRKQKQWLVRMESMLKDSDEATGLLGLLDDLQDEATKVLGDDVVFGKK
jgi:hypothetical protein